MSVPLLAAVGLAERLALRLLAATAPWSSRSQHDCWRAGYVEGLRDGLIRAPVSPQTAPSPGPKP